MDSRRSSLRVVIIITVTKCSDEDASNHYLLITFASFFDRDLLCKIKRKKVSLKDHKLALKKPEVPREASASEGDKAILEVTHRLYIYSLIECSEESSSQKATQRNG